jgi:C4-dicarboxylate transporter DctQ subunit
MKKFLNVLSKIEGWMAIICAGSMTFLVILDVIARELFNSGFPWAQKGAVFLMIWAGYLGAIIVSSKAAHLRPEIGDKVWGEKKQELFVRVQNLVTLAFCSIFTYGAIRYVIESREFGDKSVVTGISLWILQLVIPYTFASMAIRNLYYLVNPKEQLSLEKGFH